MIFLHGFYVKNQPIVAPPYPPKTLFEQISVYNIQGCSQTGFSFSGQMVYEVLSPFIPLNIHNHHPFIVTPPYPARGSCFEQT